jgi:hypothetical protein
MVKLWGLVLVIFYNSGTVKGTPEAFYHSLNECKSALEVLEKGTSFEIDGESTTRWVCMRVPRGVFANNY